MNIRRRITDFLAGHSMLLLSGSTGVLVIAIGLTLYLRARPVFLAYGWRNVLFGTTWLPSNGQFGLHPFIMGTIWVTLLAIVLAVPVCMLASIYLSEYAHPKVRGVIKPLIDLLAGIPSVVYGVWGLLVVVPFISDKLGPYAVEHWKQIPFLSTEYTTGYSLLAAGIVLAIMIIPVLIAISFEVMRAVPSEYRDASYAVGATRFETIIHVVMRKSFPGLIAAVVLGVSRALGETMAVLMLIGNVPLVPKSVFDPASTLPSLIANNYGEMMSIPLYDSALLGAAFVLLLVVIFFNLAARIVMVKAVRWAR